MEQPTILVMTKCQLWTIQTAIENISIW